MEEGADIDNICPKDQARGFFAWQHCEKNEAPGAEEAVPSATPAHLKPLRRTGQRRSRYLPKGADGLIYSLCACAQTSKRWVSMNWNASTATGVTVSEVWDSQAGTEVVAAIRRLDIKKSAAPHRQRSPHLIPAPRRVHLTGWQSSENKERGLNEFR